MKIPAVKFVASQPRPTLHAMELDLASAADLNALRGDGLPAAYIVRAPNLAGLRELKPLIIDRGTKHPAKPLAKLLLGRDKPILIDGAFASVVQLKRSVNALLANACTRGDRNVYFIGAPSAVFEVLQRQAIPRRIHVASSAETLLDHLRDELVPKEIANRYIGRSDQVQLVHHLIVCAARVDVPVLIVSETGTGKEIVARLIHEHSARKNETFVPVNCAAIPAALFESELFGHKRGAFTDAKADKEGLWKYASEGTLFLDEIADLDPIHQAKILRAMDSGEFRPLGGKIEIKSNARIIAATNRDLAGLVRAGRFREDLFYRLFAFQIATPPLRDHPDDIPLLARHFWGQITRDDQAVLPDDLVTELQTYRWPGNARELRAVLTRLRVLSTATRPGLNASLLRTVFYSI